MSGSARSRRCAVRKAAPGKRKPAGLPPAARRWVFIGSFTLALLVGLPLAHALIGEIGAILLGTFAFGFVVGRMTLRR